MNQVTRTIPISREGEGLKLSDLPATQYYVVASNELSEFVSEMNERFSQGWEPVMGTMVGFGMSHEMRPDNDGPPKFPDKAAEKHRRYTQANFLCIVRLNP